MWLADQIPGEYRTAALVPNKSHFEALPVFPHALAWCRDAAQANR
jgi:hypothetical protein